VGAAALCSDLLVSHTLRVPREHIAYDAYFAHQHYDYDDYYESFTSLLDRAEPFYNTCSHHSCTPFTRPHIIVIVIVVGVGVGG